MADEYLEHYGVLGMKWGVRKDPQKAYRKSMTKLSKLDTKSKKKKMKSEYQKSKSDAYRAKNEQLKDKFFFKFGAIDRFREKRLARKGSKYARKSRRSLKASQRARRRAERWVKSMNREFSNITVDQISTEDIALGREYVIQMLEDYRSDH